MKTSEKWRTSFLIVVIFLLIGALLGNKPITMVQTNPNQPSNEYQAVMFYNPKTSKLFAQGFQHFTYGLDSCIHTIDINNGENKFYFVLYDMSIEFKVIKYGE